MAYCLDPPMLITDHMKQGNLLQYLRKHEWNFNVANKLLLDVTSGLTYLHANNVVHGDLKGANILISDDRAVIADFGMSRIRPPAPLGHSTMAPPTTIGGTTGFMAPEVLLGRSARPPADVFAFGMVCYEVYSEGQRPFKGVPDYRIKTWVEDGRRPVRPIKLEADCDDIWRLMEDCWKQDPKTRPEAAVVRNRLDEIIMSRELRLGRLGN